MSDVAGDFANRLRKRHKHLARWARRERAEAYRVYDRDIPEHPVAVDRYGSHAHVQEYRRRRRAASAAELEGWRAAVLDATAEVLQIPRENVVHKVRQRQGSGSQYEKQPERSVEIVVREGEHRFVVELARYLDTGLFLDHRLTRRLVGERAAGKRFLNLFAYTGSFTVYAAAAGARRTVSVDLSNTYLAWARRNLRLGGLEHPRHELIRADVFDFLKQDRERGRVYDLMVVDPPTLSRSKRMRFQFDVQTHHVPLLQRCLRQLAPGGLLLFSTNFQRFELQADAIEGAAFEEITARTIPEDFRRHRPHRCWEVRHA